MSESQAFDINFLNALIANKEVFYEILSDQKGLYLPALKSQTITCEYLLGVTHKKFFSISRSAIKEIYFNKKVLKSELFEALKTKLPEINLGFDLYSLPEKN